MKYSICVDFDGTIREDSVFTTGPIPGDPLPDAHLSLKQLSKHYYVYIYTTRVSPHWDPLDQANQMNEVLNWLKRHGFVKGVHYHKIIGYKLPAVAYIDDKAIKFTNWNDVLKGINYDTLGKN